MKVKGNYGKRIRGKHKIHQNIKIELQKWVLQHKKDDKFIGLNNIKLELSNYIIMRQVKLWNKRKEGKMEGRKENKGTQAYHYNIK